MMKQQICMIAGSRFSTTCVCGVRQNPAPHFFFWLPQHIPNFYDSCDAYFFLHTPAWTCAGARHETVTPFWQPLNNWDFDLALDRFMFSSTSTALRDRARFSSDSNLHAQSCLTVFAQNRWKSSKIKDFELRSKIWDLSAHFQEKWRSPSKKLWLWTFRICNQIEKMFKTRGARSKWKFGTVSCPAQAVNVHAVLAVLGTERVSLCRTDLLSLVLWTFLTKQRTCNFFTVWSLSGATSKEGMKHPAPRSIPLNRLQGHFAQTCNRTTNPLELLMDLLRDGLSMWLLSEESAKSRREQWPGQGFNKPDEDISWKHVLHVCTPRFCSRFLFERNNFWSSTSCVLPGRRFCQRSAHTCIDVLWFQHHCTCESARRRAPKLAWTTRNQDSRPCPLLIARLELIRRENSQ